MTTPAILKLQYHARTARNLVNGYSKQAEQHNAEVVVDGSSTIDIDNMLRLIELYEAELDSFEAALVILEKAEPKQPVVTPPLVVALTKGMSGIHSGLPAYCIRFTSGPYVGRYLGLHHNAVKSKQIAMTLVRHSDPDSWFESCGVDIDTLGNPTFEVIRRRNR